jgi:hypothetical protein
MRPELRLSDADRDRAITRLGEHYAAGRIDKDEFDERSDAVWTARTAGDLAPVFADLAPSVPVRQGRRHPALWPRRGWFPVPFLPVLFVLIALTALTHVPFVLLAFLGWAVFVGRHRRRSHW